MLHQDASPQALAFVRIWVYGLWFVFIALTALADLHDFPLELIGPVGPLRLLPRPALAYLMTGAGLWALKLLLLAALAAATVGIGRHRLVAIVACVLLTLFESIRLGCYGSGHQKMAMLYAAYILAVFPAADVWSLRPRKGALAKPVTYAAPIVAITLVLLLAYHFVAKPGGHIFCSYVESPANLFPDWLIGCSLRVVEVDLAGADKFFVGRCYLLPSRGSSHCGSAFLVFWLNLLS